VQTVEPGLSVLFQAAERADPSATDHLFNTLYCELRRLASRELAKQGSGSYLSATTLLHEAYLEMSPEDRAIFPDRVRFMGYAARVMRGPIIEHARMRSAQKRGGSFEITSAGGDIQNRSDLHELTRISDALDELANSDAALSPRPRP
jgi:RNA polymerase sigma factor (TIGR02999 family)